MHLNCPFHFRLLMLLRLITKTIEASWAHSSVTWSVTHTNFLKRANLQLRLLLSENESVLFVTCCLLIATNWDTHECTVESLWMAAFRSSQDAS